MNIVRRFLAVFLGSILPLCGATITHRGGIVPDNSPWGFGAAALFLPYNPNVLFVGDRVADLGAAMARMKDRAAIYCVSSERDDLAALDEYSKEFANIHAYYGQIHDSGVEQFYWSTLPQPEGVSRFAGSLLQPTDSWQPLLYGEKRNLPTYALRQFCDERDLHTIHLLSLNCGGNELQILKSHPEMVKQAIVVQVKTYHKRIRAGLPLFAELDQFMRACDFVLMSHHVYDNVIGDALYVKRRYFRAVYNIKEL